MGGHRGEHIVHGPALGLAELVAGLGADVRDGSAEHHVVVARRGFPGAQALVASLKEARE